VITARILGTGSVLSGRQVSTEEVVRRALPGKDAARLAERIGIWNRYWVEDSATASGLAAEAGRKALETAGCDARDVRRLIFVSSTSGDTVSPANAHAVAEALGLDDSCDGFDINNACTGFLSALDVAARSVATGLGPVLITVSELFSRFISPEEPRPYLVLADAAAAVLVGPGREGEGFLASHLRCSADVRGKVMLPHPGFRGQRSHFRFDATYEEMTDGALGLIQSASQRVLDEAGVALRDVEWFVPHQPNGRMLETLLERMAVSPERVMPVVGEIGSVGAASIPVSLDRLMRGPGVRPGQRLLMTAVGAGTGFGAMLYRVGG